MSIVRFVLIWASIIFIIACFSGCGQTITSGEVVGKQFIPEHQEERDEPDMQIGDVWIPGGTYTVTVPDAWNITIEKKCEDGETRRRVIWVTQELYDSLKEGDWYNLGE